MKVLMVTTFPPRRCGIGDYAADLVTRLSRTDDLELRILTYSDGLTKGVAREDSFEVSRGLGRVFSARHLAKEIRAYEPDLVHLQSASFLHPPSVNRKVAETCEVPLVTTVHDTPGSWRVFRAIPGLRKVYGKSSCLFVHTAAVKGTLCHFHAVDGRKVVEIAHGVDLDRYSPHAPREEALRRYAMEGQRIVLFFGFVRPGKGLETLLMAWSKIEHSVPNAVLVIAGGVPTEVRRYDLLLRNEADYPDRIRKLAAQLGILNRVVFTGYVDGSLVPGLLASSEVVVLPHKGGVSQSGPVHKALASGCAVIATDVPGFRAVVGDGESGMLVPPQNPDALAEAIRTLLEDPAKAREFGRQARAKAETSLSWSTVAARTFDVYESLLSTEGSGISGASVPA